MAILDPSAVHKAAVSWTSDVLASDNDYYYYLGVRILAAATALYIAGRVVYLLNFSPLSGIPGDRLSRLTMLRMKTNALLGRLGDA
ncbi:hypothetical protein H4S06_005197, partial [Coemansia sp. BCRC 34490]